MTKQVLLTIAGLQVIDEEQAEPIEIVTAGDYFFRNGKHYILYEEPVEGSGKTIQNTVKISPNSLEVMKKGLMNVHMVFEQNKKNLSCYETPYGTMMVGIQTSDMDIRETENNIDIQVNYGLEINDEYLADYQIKMNIKSKNAGDFSLQQ